MTERFGIIGAGMAGLACAHRLLDAGHEVVLFDKGRRPGGRMSSRTVETERGVTSFDYGAPWFDARDPAFRDQVVRWHRAGAVAPWPVAGIDAWVGTPTMSAPLELLANDLAVSWSTRIKRITGQPGRWTLQGADLEAGPFDIVLLAVPPENASPLLDPVAPGIAARIAPIRSSSCWTVMAAFAGLLPIEDIISPTNGPIALAVRNSAKPGRRGPEAWVMHAGDGWSAEHLERSPAEISPLVLRALSDQVGATLPVLLTTIAHRWRYARPRNASPGTVWDDTSTLGLCGDWLIGETTENAWCAGRALGSAG